MKILEQEYSWGEYIEFEDDGSCGVRCYKCRILYTKEQLRDAKFYDGECPMCKGIEEKSRT